MLGLKIVKRLCLGNFCRETVRSLKKRKFYNPTPASPPSPAMGGELVTTKMLDHNTVLAPPRLRTPEVSLALSTPHPSKGRGPGKGDGVKEYCHQTICSQRGNKKFPTWEYKETPPNILTLNKTKEKMCFSLFCARLIVSLHRNQKI